MSEKQNKISENAHITSVKVNYWFKKHQKSLRSTFRVYYSALVMHKPFNSIQFTLIQYSTIQYNSIQFNSVHFNSIRRVRTDFFDDFSDISLCWLERQGHSSALLCSALLCFADTSWEYPCLSSQHSEISKKSSKKSVQTLWIELKSELNWIVLNWIVLNCIELNCIELNWTELNWMAYASLKQNNTYEM